jgi:hypothetical protein
MLAVKRGNVAIARIILEFGIDPAILLLKDADGSTPLHVAVQRKNTVLAELLLKRGPTQLPYTENSVGQTPMDIASLKGLPRETPAEVTPRVLPLTVEERSPRKAPPFDVEKQKIEIPKLRATLDTLLAEGRIVHGTKLTTELLAFASRMEGRLAVETARKDATEKQAEGGEVYPLRAKPQGTYFALCDVAEARPGTRQLVHLADVQRSVRRDLAQQAEGSFVTWSQHSEEEHEETDPEDQRIEELKARSLFASASLSDFVPEHVDIYGEDEL